MSLAALATWHTRGMHDVIVVGAGIAGLICAQRLQRSGYRVVVIDKSRGLGGRLATRRAEVNNQSIRFNHGVQYITAETDGFHRFLRNLSNQSVLQEWARALHCLDATGLYLEPVDAQKVRYVAEPGISAIAKHIAQDLECVLDSRITQLQHSENGWRVQAEAGQPWTAPALVLALPAPQIVPLMSTVLPDEHSLLQLVQSVEYAPSLAVMAAYTQPVAPEWKGIKWLADPQIAWLAAHQGSESLTTVVLHTTADFAQAHLDEQPELSVGEALLRRAAEALEPWLAEPVFVQLHRWRYAFPIEAVGSSSVSTTLGASLLACAGDWCAGNRVESAYLSGEATAQKVQRWLSDSAVSTVR